MNDEYFFRFISYKTIKHVVKAKTLNDAKEKLSKLLPYACDAFKWNEYSNHEISIIDITYQDINDKL